MYIGTKCLILLICVSGIYGRNKGSVKEKGVVFKLYYEAQCPFSKRLMTSKPYLQTISQFSSFINLQLIPYGDAKTLKKNGTLTFTCQHGPLECYGNKLHACAIKVLQNATKSAIYNSCMMDMKNEPGSNDAAADYCGTSLLIDAKPIIHCAKGTMGSKLLKRYGVITKKARDVNYVPYISLNGVENDGKNLSSDVCEVFLSLSNKNPMLTARCKKFI